MLKNKIENFFYKKNKKKLKLTELAHQIHSPSYEIKITS